MEKFSTVEDFLIAQMSQRPVTYKEITLCVDKHERGILVEIRRLVRYGRVHIIEVKFKERITPFYTIRKNVSAELVENVGKYANPLNKKIARWKPQTAADHGTSRRGSGGASTTQSDDRGDSSSDGGFAGRRHRVFKRRPGSPGPYLVASAEETEF